MVVSLQVGRGRAGPQPKVSPRKRSDLAPFGELGAFQDRSQLAPVEPDTVIGAAIDLHQRRRRRHRDSAGSIRRRQRGLASIPSEARGAAPDPAAWAPAPTVSRQQLQLTLVEPQPAAVQAPVELDALRARRRPGGCGRRDSSFESRSVFRRESWRGIASTIPQRNRPLFACGSILLPRCPAARVYCCALGGSIGGERRNGRSCKSAKLPGLAGVLVATLRLAISCRPAALGLAGSAEPQAFVERAEKPSCSTCGSRPSGRLVGQGQLHHRGHPEMLEAAAMEQLMGVTAELAAESTRFDGQRPVRTRCAARSC